MTKSEQKQLAKDILLETIASAYYKLYDEHDEISEESHACRMGFFTAICTFTE